MGEEKAPATARAGLLTSEDEASMDQISPKAQPSMAAMEEGRAEVPVKNRRGSVSAPGGTEATEWKDNAPEAK